MESMWRFIVEASRRLDVQVFATSHSGDCLRALAWLQAEQPEARDLDTESEFGGSVAATVARRRISGREWFCTPAEVIGRSLASRRLAKLERRMRCAYPPYGR